MKKLNKQKVCTMLICIVLMLSNVFATSTTTNSVITSVEGAGTSANPYVIDCSSLASGASMTIRYNTLPFYFVVDGLKITEKITGRVFRLSFDQNAQTVTFTALDTVSMSNNTSSNTVITNHTIMLDDEEFNSENHQLGITPVKNGGGALGVSTPEYSIEEIATYYTPGSCIENMTYGRKNILAGSNYSEVPNKDYYKVTRKIRLNNVNVSNSSIQGSKGDLYFFTSSRNKSNVANLFTPLYFKNIVDDEYKYALEFAGYALDDGWLVYSRDEIDYDLEGMFKENATGDVEIPAPDTDVFSNNETVATVMYKFNGNSNSAFDDTGEASGLEALVTQILVSLGDHLLLGMLKSILGTELTIDSLIFNTYEPTKLSLYASGSNEISNAITSTVNVWYNIFTALAYIAYLVILVYIGIKILLSVGTDNQSKAKNYIVNWIMGLAILYVVPNFCIPALVKINDAFVELMAGERQTMKTYYNVYSKFDELGKADILGSDSATVSIEELLGEINVVTEEMKDASNEMSTISRKNMLVEHANHLFGCDANGKMCILSLTENFTADIDKSTIRTYATRIADIAYPNVYTTLNEIKERNGGVLTYSDELREQVVDSVVASWDAAWGNYRLYRESNLSQAARVALNSAFKVFYDNWEAFNNNQAYVDVLTEYVNFVENDFMGEMRAAAGRYKRLIFAIIWYAMLFQLIALVFLYFKRIFVIAILIAIFPLIMIFYSIDKMADGSAQTLSLWFKELMANIFIQSVHCVIYVVLIDVGFDIYKNDSTDWIIFMAAMLLILPAEKIMKDVFNLNGVSLRALGGMGAKLAIGIGAIKTFMTSRKTSVDKDFQKKSNAKIDALQRSQDRADNKAFTREAKRQANGRTINGFGKVRDGMWSVGTATRKAAAKATPVVRHTFREAKNTAAIAAGVAYGIASGADAESMYAGAQVAKGLSGRTEKLKSEERNLKSDITAAYKRRKNGP